MTWWLSSPPTVDIRLHRMHWQRVWHITPKNSPAACCAWKTTSHSWKSSAKLLAVGHQNGDISFIEIEKAVVVHTLKLGSAVTSMEWVHVQLDTPVQQSHGDFLPEVHKEELSEHLMRGQAMSSDEEQQCFLTVSTEDGKVRLYLDGIFLALELTIAEYPTKFQKHLVTSTHLSPSTGILTVVSKSTPSNLDVSPDDDTQAPAYYLHRFHCPSLVSNTKELCLLSRAYTQLHFLVERSLKVLNQLSDSSEDISLKINSKLEKLDSMLGGGTGADGVPVEGISSVAAEFTIAYATGETSSELETFLSQHLTTKGLKQIEQSVQLAYASMHSDITEELEVLIQHTMVYLLHIHGMSRWTERFASLGLKEDVVLGCLNMFATFEMKVLKVLEVISSDMEDFAIFFTWLTCLCYQVTNSETQPTFPQLSFKEFDNMVNFLEHRLKKSPGACGTFNLERISHFFNQNLAENSPLLGDDISASDKQNTWYEYVQNNACLKDNPLIITPGNRVALLEQFRGFHKNLDGIFESVHRAVSFTTSPIMSVKLFDVVVEGHDESCAPVVSFMKKGGDGANEGVTGGNSDSLRMLLLACSCDCDRMFLLDIPNPADTSSSTSMLNTIATKGTINVAGLSIEPPLSSNLSMEGDKSINEDDAPQYTVKYASFYGDTHITVLYESSEQTDSDQSTSILSQLPLQETLKDLQFAKCNTDTCNVVGRVGKRDQGNHPVTSA